MSDLSEAVEAAIASNVEEGDMLLKFVAIAEVIDAASGERCLYTVAQDGAQAWDVLGMLGFAYQQQQALASIAFEAIISHEAEEGEE